MSLICFSYQRFSSPDGDLWEMEFSFLANTGLSRTLSIASSTERLELLGYVIIIKYNPQLPCWWPAGQTDASLLPMTQEGTEDKSRVTGAELL